jgi:peroxiredoxin Q/BCP
MSAKLLSVGQKAPSFSLKNQDGDTVSLSDFAGKKTVVLYFYPKALTPGCTTQACSIRDSQSEFAEVNAVVLGMSPDPVELIKKFQDKYSLNFHLLSDLGHKVAEAYGVWGEKSMFGKLTQGLRRITFIIGKDGLIKHVMPKVNTKTHHDDVLEFIKEHKL